MLEEKDSNAKGMEWIRSTKESRRIIFTAICSTMDNVIPTSRAARPAFFEKGAKQDFASNVTDHPHQLQATTAE